MGHITGEDGVCTLHCGSWSCSSSCYCLPLLVSWHGCEFLISHPYMLPAKCPSSALFIVLSLCDWFCHSSMCYLFVRSWWFKCGYKSANAWACFLSTGCLYHSFNVRKFGITCSISEWFIGLQWKKSTWKVFFALQGMWTTCLIIYSNCSAIPDGDCI
jgi:hypothetical protein